MDPIKTEVVVVGAGPGGYAAAFYAADHGKKVVLVERDQRLGGRPERPHGTCGLGLPRIARSDRQSTG